MVLINKVFIKENMSIYIGLKKIYGINNHYSLFICNKFKLNPNMKIKKLNNLLIKKINIFFINNSLTISELKKKEFFFIKKNIDIKNYKGLKKKLKINE